jgi:hypothetical protein
MVRICLPPPANLSKKSRQSGGLDAAPTLSRSPLAAEGVRDWAKGRSSPPRRVIDSRLGKIAFGPLCQQCTEAIVQALLRGQHHHRGKRGLCRMWGVSRAHS